MSWRSESWDKPTTDKRVGVWAFQQNSREMLGALYLCDHPTLWLASRWLRTISKNMFCRISRFSSKFHWLNFTVVEFFDTTIYMWCTFDIHLIYIWCTCDIHLIYMWYTFDIHVMYMWYTFDLHVMYMWYTFDSHVMYIWYTFDLHVMYIWYTCELPIRMNFLGYPECNLAILQRRPT